MLIDQVCNLSPSQKSVVFLSVALRHLLFFGGAHAWEASSMQTQSSHQAYRRERNLFALYSIVMSQDRQLISLSQLL